MDYDAERHRDGGWNKFFANDRPLEPGHESLRFAKHKAAAKPPKPAPRLRGSPDDWFARELRKFEAAARKDPSRATYDFMGAAKRVCDLGLISADQHAKYVAVITGNPRTRADWARRAKAAASRAPPVADARPWRANMGSRGAFAFHDAPAHGETAPVAEPPPQWAAPRRARHVSTRDALFAGAIAAAVAGGDGMPPPAATGGAAARPASASAAALGARARSGRASARPQSAGAVAVPMPTAARTRAPAYQMPPEDPPYATKRMEHDNNWNCRRPGASYDNWRPQM